MTAQQAAFDRLLAEVLDASGPQAVPVEFIDEAIAGARATTQRRPVIRLVDARAWPGSAPSIWARPDRWSALVLGMVAVGLILVIVGGLMWSGAVTTPSPQPTPPAARPSGASVRATLVEGPRTSFLVAAAVGLQGGAVLMYGWTPEGRLTAAILDAGASSWRSLPVDAIPFAAIDAEPLALQDGRVFLLAQRGITEGGTPEAVIFDPSTEQFASGIPATLPRSGGRAVELLDGRVLVLGGDADASGKPQWAMEIFDPRLGQWSAAGVLDLAAGDLGLGPVRLPDGHLLMTSYQSASDATIDVFIIDPVTGGTTKTRLDPSALIPDGSGAELVDAAGLADGRILLFSSPNDTGRGVVFSWAPGAPKLARFATVVGGDHVLELPGSRFLLLQGSPGAATVWDSGTGAAETVGPFAATYPMTVLLPDGRVMLFGGYVRDAPIGPSGTAPSSDAVQFLRFD